MKGNMSKSKTKVLVVFQDNWADEMTVSSWQIVDKEEWEEAEAKFSDLYKDQEVEIGLGSNESIDYKNAEDFLTNVRVVDVLPEEIKAIKRLFGTTDMTKPLDILEAIKNQLENVDDEADSPFDEDSDTEF